MPDIRFEIDGVEHTVVRRTQTQVVTRARHGVSWWRLGDGQLVVGIGMHASRWLDRIAPDDLRRVVTCLEPDSSGGGVK